MNVKELEKLVETSFELNRDSLYIIGLKNIPKESFTSIARGLSEYLKSEGISSLIIPASDIDKIYKLEKSNVK